MVNNTTLKASKGCSLMQPHSNRPVKEPVSLLELCRIWIVGLWVRCWGHIFFVPSMLFPHCEPAQITPFYKFHPKCYLNVTTDRSWTSLHLFNTFKSRKCGEGNKESHAGSYREPRRRRWDVRWAILWKESRLIRVKISLFNTDAWGSLGTVQSIGNESKTIHNHSLDWIWWRGYETDTVTLHLEDCVLIKKKKTNRPQAQLEVCSVLNCSSEAIKNGREPTPAHTSALLHLRRLFIDLSTWQTVVSNKNKSCMKKGKNQWQ